jgi:hypothetical protein
MCIYNLDVADVMNWVCEYHYKTRDKFLALRQKVPSLSFGSEADRALEEYTSISEKTLVTMGATPFLLFESSARRGLTGFSHERMAALCL